MKYDLDYVFVDARIAGAEIIELAAIRTNRRGKVLKAWHSRVAFSGKIDEETIKKHSYSPDEWQGSPSLLHALQFMKDNVVSGYEEKYIVVAHHIEPTRLFIREAAKSVNLEDPFIGRAWLDTAQIAWPLIHSGALTNRSLEALAEFFSVVNQNPHSAMGTVETLMHTYWVMIRRMSGAVTVGETAIRLAENSDVVKKGLRYFGI